VLKAVVLSKLDKLFALNKNGTVAKPTLTSTSTCLNPATSKLKLFAKCELQKDVNMSVNASITFMSTQVRVNSLELKQ